MSSFYCEYDQGRQDFQMNSGHTSSGHTYNLHNKTSAAAGTSTNHFHAQNRNSGSSILPKIEMGDYFSDSHQHFKQQISSDYTSNTSSFGTPLPAKEAEYRKTTAVNGEYPNQQNHGSHISIHQPHHIINPQSIAHPNFSLPHFRRCNTDESTKYFNNSTVTPNTFYSSNPRGILLKSEPSSMQQIPFNQAPMTPNFSQLSWDTNSRVKTQIPTSNNSYSPVQENYRNVGLLNSSPQSYPFGNSSSSVNSYSDIQPRQFASSSSVPSMTKDTYSSHSMNRYESSIGVSPNLYPSIRKQTNYQGSSNMYPTYQPNKSLQSSNSASASLNTYSSTTANKPVVVGMPYHSSSLITETKLRSMLIAPTHEEYVPMKPFVSTQQQTQNVHCYPSVYKQMLPNDRQQNLELPSMHRKPTPASSSSEYVSNAFKQHSYQHLNNDKQRNVFGDSVALPTASNSITNVQQNAKDQHEQSKYGQISESKIQPSSRFAHLDKSQGPHFNGTKQILISQRESHPVDKDKKCNCNQTCHSCLPRQINNYPGKSEMPPFYRNTENILEKHSKSVGSGFRNLHTSTNNESRPNLMQYKTKMFVRKYSSSKDAGQLNRYSPGNIKQFQLESTNTGREKVKKLGSPRSKNSFNSFIAPESNIEETEHFKFPQVIESPIKFRTKGELKQMCPPPAQSERQDPILSEDEWNTWSSSFSNEWEKFMVNLSAMKNVKRVYRISKLKTKTTNLDLSVPFTTNQKDESLSEEDVPLSVRREKTKRDEKSSLKRKKSEDLSPSDLPSTNLLDIHKQESLIAAPLSKPIKLEINTDDVLPAEHEANDMQLDSTNVLDIKAEPQQFKSESVVSESRSSEYLNISNSTETTLHRTAELGQLQSVRHLLEQPETDISLRDSYGYTALEIACTKGYVDVARVLLEYGASANLNSQNDIIRSLKEAIKNDHIEVARLLLSYGAEPVSDDENLILLCKSESMKEFLSAYINDINGNISSSWGFFGSVCFMDATIQGFNALDCSILDEC